MSIDELLEGTSEIEPVSSRGEEFCTMWGILNRIENAK